MNATLYNQFYISTDNTIGSWNTSGYTPSAQQLVNANNIKSFFVDQEGWTLNSVCGMLGNMMGESTINPALIQATNRWRLPNSAQNLYDVPNSVMQNFYREYYNVNSRAFGVGLVQWDGYTQSAGVPRQKMVNYAIVNNYNWYDGWTQCYRIRFECAKNDQYHFFKPVVIQGTQYTFTNFITSTDTPENLAHAFQAGYERNAGGLGYRGISARYWYNYFLQTQPAIATPPYYPLPADPSQPYDPTQPIEPPEEPVANFIPIMLLYMGNKRKELLKTCRKI